MKSLSAPCGNCPFLKDGGIPLRPGRLRGIVNDTIRQDSSFFCHKTTNGEESEDGEQYVAGTTDRLCAGWMIFLLARRNGHMTQMMRIEHRLRMMDPDELLKHRDKIVKVAR